MGSFDLQRDKIEEKFEGSLDIENEKWNIGVIYGASGTGKTTIAKEILESNYFVIPKFASKSIIDDMPAECSTEQITKTFTSVGFGSVPSWLKPYNVLSNGEKMRVELAYALLQDKEIVVFDEFTSVIDRQVAQIGSMCIQKNVRKRKKKFIAISCHEDIIDWLEPDWVFNTNDMTFQKTKKKDLIFQSEFSKQKKIFGDCLKNIII